MAKLSSPEFKYLGHFRNEKVLREGHNTEKMHKEKSELRAPVAPMPAWKDMEGKLISDVGAAFKSLYQDTKTVIMKPRR